MKVLSASILLCAVLASQPLLAQFRPPPGGNSGSSSQATTGGDFFREKSDLTIYLGAEHLFSSEAGQEIGSMPEFELVLEKIAARAGQRYQRATQEQKRFQRTIELLLLQVDRWTGKSNPTSTEKIKATAGKIDSLHLDYFFGDFDDSEAPRTNLVLVVNFDPVELVKDLESALEADGLDMLGKTEYLKARSHIVEQSDEGYDYLKIIANDKDDFEMMEDPNDRSILYLGAVPVGGAEEKFAVVFGNDKLAFFDRMKGFEKNGSRILSAKPKGVVASIEMDGSILEREGGPSSMIETMGFDPDGFLDKIEFTLTAIPAGAKMHMQLDLEHPEDAPVLQDTLTGAVGIFQLGALGEDVSENMSIIYELAGDIEFSVDQGNVVGDLTIPKVKLNELVGNIIEQILLAN